MKTKRKLTDKQRIDWLETRSVRVAWKEDSIPNLMAHEPPYDFRWLLDQQINIENTKPVARTKSKAESGKGRK